MKNPVQRDTMDGYLRDLDRRLRNIERRPVRLVAGTNGGGGGTPNWPDGFPTYDPRYVNVGGDAMQGDLVLAADPDMPMEAATKQYVDSLIGGGESGVDEVYIGSGPPPDPTGLNPALELWYDPGASMPGAAYIFNQGVASTVWTIDHPLDFFPNVTVIDSAGTQVEGDVHYVDADTISITFTAAFSGTAYLS
ncbi:MAG TPA: hypothetical protein VIX41_11025 [Acidimicrobiales bacterium]